MYKNKRKKKAAGPVRRMNLVIGKAYIARKGSTLRMSYGHDAVFMVIELPAVVLLTTFINVLGPAGRVLCVASDLRPVEDIPTESE